ncbi:GGDEF domain-containing protein [Chelatococcus asaccharovorans]|uniref:GGDEF domain-containing protein n=1 Tax=Chelatococcus asaccharovorans TaxID=28210 RepID=UPI00224C7800|nr:diguanylate cyclase [Chelatococcus asaccharovorans]CAH1653692.1 Response regulator receiver modulated diguanylate cyclase [Chelatococcus asaccharovorans]CAH1694271.1 Response regulator receiver modulated diguanylate cyclase [Chelatococcus asaccharovorans]
MNDLTTPTVLIVDDEPMNRMALAELLSGECRLLLAKDGASALQRVADEPDISLILLDVSMPGMGGYEVLRRLRADARTADIGVIFVTGHTDERDEERGLLLGAQDYVSKPIRPAIVKARVRNYLKLAMQRRELERLSQQDSLTGIANRRHFDEELARACRHARRSQESLSLAMIDVDHFKQYNDHYGHGAGDDALRRIAHTLAGVARRPYDLVARYGGEEFVLLLPGVADVEAVLEQARREVMQLGIAHQMSTTASVLTVSCGGIVADAGRLPKTKESLLNRADEVLYRAKREGRNRVLTERF